MYFLFFTNHCFKYTLIILFTLVPFKGNAQNIAGIWTGGNEEADGWVHPQKLVLELTMENDSLISGVSHTYYKKNKYEHYRLKGTYNSKNNTVILREISVLSVKLGFLETNYLGNYTLQLSCDAKECNLTGKWSPNKKGFSLFQDKYINTFFKKPADKIELPQKQVQPKDSVLVPKDARLKRYSDIQSLIEVPVKKEGIIKLEIYDNGIIDHDSISLFLDDSLLINKQEISTNAIVVNIPLEKIKAISKLKLVAESLGTIPPCSAIMVVTIDNKRYEVSLSGDLTRNAEVEFFLKE